MTKRPLIPLFASVLFTAVLFTAGCSTADSATPVPGLAERGTTLTTAKLSRQDMTNRVSLAGKVTINPIFGLVAPADGEIRYVEVKDTKGTPTKPTRAGAIWAAGKPTDVDIPAGATFAGRLVDDRAKVTEGMPVLSAKFAGYGIVADIDGAQAYTLSDGLAAITAQIKSGPGPFGCAVLGTIAALPPGTIPDPAPVAPPAQDQAGLPGAPQTAASPPARQPQDSRTPSEATGMRLVCTPPADVKLINGAEATLEVITARATGVLVAPVEAVAGRQGAGKVDVLGPDGARRTVDVRLGLTDGRVIEIRGGLTGGEILAVPGPNLPDAPQKSGS